jgi:hypothetical protein
MALTPEQEDYKRQLAEAKEKDRDALLRGCRHYVEQAPPGVDPGFVSCAICGKGFRWYCPASPDHTCHYWSTDDQIELIDGTTVPVTGRHDPSNESREWCIFCGDPYERK